MGHFSQAAKAAWSRRWFFFPWLPWPWAPLSQRLSPLLILTTATMALVITDMLATPMPTVATTTAKGLLSLPLPPSLLLIPTTATTDFATTGTLATPTLMLDMAIITARGLLRPLPLPSPSPTMATMATPMPMALLSMARGLLKLPQLPSLPPILTTATTAFATTVMLAILTPMVVTTMESKKE